MNRAIALGLAAGVVAVLAVVPGGPAAIATAMLGVLLLAGGRYRVDRGWVRLGGLVLFVAIVLAGLRATPDGLVLLATVAAAVAWDASDNAVAYRRQLGGAAVTGRSQLVHLGATTVAGGSVAALALLTATVARGQLPAITGIVFVGGVVLLTLGLVPFARDAAS